MKNKIFIKLKKIMVVLMITLITFAINIISTKAKENLQTNSQNNSFVNDKVDLGIESPSAILIETSTNTIIYEKNSKEHRPPASMTKIMTMILVMEEIDKGNLKYSEMVVASENASRMGGTTIYLDTGEEMSVHDLLKGVAITSANDAAVCLAERIGGTEENFVKMMNDKAREIGCNDTNFVNPNGLPEDNHYSCAHDMGIMGSYLVTNHPEILKYTSIYEDYLRKGTEKEFWLVNTNKLVRFYKNVDGLKTGWTNDAGYCLTATMEENNIRFVSVVMGGSSPAKRNSEIMTMLKYGVSSYELIKICEKEEVIEIVKDIKCKPSVYTVVVPKEINILVKKGNNKLDIKKEVELNGLENNYINIYINNSHYKKVDLVILEEVERASVINIIWCLIKDIFLGY